MRVKAKNNENFSFKYYITNNFHSLTKSEPSRVYPRLIISLPPNSPLFLGLLACSTFNQSKVTCTVLMLNHGHTQKGSCSILNMTVTRWFHKREICNVCKRVKENLTSISVFYNMPGTQTAA